MWVPLSFCASRRRRDSTIAPPNRKPDAMGRKIAIAAGVLVAVIAVAAVVVLGRLGRIIGDGVETEGPKITGTDVSLGGAQVSIFDGEGALKRLRIANPEGFSKADAFDLGKIAIKVDVKSVTSGVVHIR